MQRKTKALVKDLELQIDYLVGYSNQGLHWKREYHFREKLIDLVLCDENTPPEIIEKINVIQEKLFMIRNKEAGEQPYMTYLEIVERKKHTVRVNDYKEKEPYYFEI